MQTKEERSELNRQYYIRNRKRIRLSRKKEYAGNKEQHRIKDEKYREDNHEKIKQRQKEWYIDNIEKVRANKLKNSYGITLEQYNLMCDVQEGKCLICNVHQNDLKQLLEVDHDHKTNKIRGLLCHKCNTLLGYANENINVLDSAIKYLKNNL
jgi:hypothetical protein